MDARTNAIIRYLQKRGFATPEELAAVIGVSTITIRRDLTRLEEQMLIRRVHGGAIPVRNALTVAHVASRLQENPQLKRAIALFAVGLIKRGDILFLDAGSTCCYVAERLPDHMDLTVITHSLDNLNALKEKTGIRVIGLGGELNERLNAFVGPVTEAQLVQFRADRAFIGAASLDLKRGCGDNTIVERAIKASMNRQARQSCILADRSKFGAPALHLSIPLAEIKTIVTNRGGPSKHVRGFRKTGIQIIEAP